MFKITGLDEAIKKLNDIQKKADSINRQSVPMAEVLTPTFLLRCTPFASIDAMYEASGFKIENAEDFAAVPDDEWDSFIRSVSSYADWQAMLDDAAKEWTVNKLGL